MTNGRQVKKMDFLRSINSETIPDKMNWKNTKVVLGWKDSQNIENSNFGYGLGYMFGALTSALARIFARRKKRLVSVPQTDSESSQVAVGNVIVDENALANIFDTNTIKSEDIYGNEITISLNDLAEIMRQAGQDDDEKFLTFQKYYFSRPGGNINREYQSQRIRESAYSLERMHPLLKAAALEKESNVEYNSAVN